MVFLYTIIGILLFSFICQCFGFFKLTGINKILDIRGGDMSSSDIDYLEYFDYVSGYGDDYYQNSINEQGKLQIMGEEGTYGEILPTSIRRIFKSANVDINSDDIMYDLGAGTGKIAAQFAYETPCQRAIGIELGERRHNLSIEVLDKLRSTGDPNSFKIEYIKGDILNFPWYKDATILFIDAFFLPSELIHDILIKIKTQCLNIKYIFLFGERFNIDELNDENVNNFEFEENWLECPASWAEECLCETHFTLPLSTHPEHRITDDITAILCVKKNGSPTLMSLAAGPNSR
eukprot:gene4395-8749_t